MLSVARTGWQAVIFGEALWSLIGRGEGGRAAVSGGGR